MNRREFFLRAGVGGAWAWAAAAGLGCASGVPRAVAASVGTTPQDPTEPASGEGEPKGAEGLDLKKSISIDALKFEGSFLDKFSLVKDVGFDGIELESPLPVPNADEYVKMREEIIAARDETGLEVSCVHNRFQWTQPFTDADRMNRKRARSPFFTAIGDAAIYGCRLVRAMPGMVKKDVPYDDAWLWAVEGFTGCMRIAESARPEVTVLIETARNSFLLSPLEMRDFVDAIDSEFAGVFLDVGNVLPNGWPEHWIRILGERIGMIGISNFSAKKGNDEGLQRGFDVGFREGDCDWPAVFGELRDIGYSGWVSAEVPPGDEDHLIETATKLDELLSG